MFIFWNFEPLHCSKIFLSSSYQLNQRKQRILAFERVERPFSSQPNGRNKTTWLFHSSHHSMVQLSSSWFSGHILAGLLPPGFHSWPPCYTTTGGTIYVTVYVTGALRSLVILNSRAALWDVPARICNILFSPPGMQLPPPSLLLKMLTIPQGPCLQIKPSLVPTTGGAIFL